MTNTPNPMRGTLSLDEIETHAQLIADRLLNPMSMLDTMLDNIEGINRTDRNRIRIRVEQKFED